MKIYRAFEIFVVASIQKHDILAKTFCTQWPLNKCQNWARNSSENTCAMEIRSMHPTADCARHPHPSPSAAIYAVRHTKTPSFNLDSSLRK